MTKRKVYQEKEVSEVKTFPVPSGLKEIKENCTIFTNTPSKEEIINKAIAFHKKGNILEALKCYKYCLKQEYIDHRVFSNYGVILKTLGKSQEAEFFLRKAIEVKPNLAGDHSNLGNVLNDLGRPKEAELSLRKAIELNPNFALGHYNLGNILNDLGRPKEAESSLRKAIKLNPDFAEAYSNLGNILNTLDRPKEAELSLRKAIELNPNSPQPYSNLGNILKDLRKLKEGEKFYLKAIELNPNYAEAHYNLGNILNDLGELKKAEIAYRKAIYHNPDFANAHYNLGSILKSQKRLEEAAISYQIALEKDPDKIEAIAELIEVFSFLSSWKNVEKYLSQLSNLDIDLQKFNPIKICNIQDEPLLFLKRATNYFNKNHKRDSSRIDFINKKYIHIGYFSADFIAHPVMYMLGRILELHDSSKFKIYIYSFAIKEDEYTQKLRRTKCIFRDISNTYDLDVVELARNDQLDIAIDLMGYSKDNRMPLFSYRVAPIQVNYLGFPASSGSNQIDYLIADKTVIPLEDQKYYSEKIVYMPNSYMCFDNTRTISQKSFTRKELNLPEDAFVMAAFHKNYKITLREIESWSKIINNVSNAKLWISSSNKIAENNILKAFKERNVSKDDIIFAPKMKSNEEHISRHSCADIFIDTFNYNAQSTAIDSLWAGLPVVTLLGKSFCSRVSSSLLTTLGLTKLIAHSEKEYEDIIIYLAKNPNKLREIKNEILQNKHKNRLFDSKQTTEDLEDLYCNLVNNLISENSSKHSLI